MALDSGDILRVSFESTDASGRLFVNTLHYRIEGDSAFPTHEPEIPSVLSKLSEHLTTEYRGCLDTGRTLNTIRGRTEVETWNGEVARVGEVTVGLAGLLSHGDGTVPDPACGVIDLRSGVASRSGRGWIMVPGSRASTALSSLGKWAVGGTYVNAMNALAAVLDDKVQETFGGVNSWHATPVIYSRTRRKAALEPFYFPVASCLVRTDVHWLRRRVTAP